MAGPRIVVIGAGPGGICAGIMLRRAGLQDFTILERADGVGGTWWHNRYPGAACDVPSDLYSFSFELKSDWSKPYAYQPEIQGYLQHCVDAYGLRPHLRLATGVRALHWDDECLLWRVVTDTGAVEEADVVISALGMFNEPRWPAVAGLDRFAGALFHSARWPDGIDLTGRDVAVIGSAASAVQLVPEVAKVAASLTVYQRTANWVLPKDDDPFDPDTIEAFRRDPMIVRQRRWKTWNALERFVLFSDARLLADAEAAGLANLSLVTDPDLRERLRPQEPFGCKRPLFSNDYYPTFNRTGVTLVTDPITELTVDGVTTADGTSRRADVVVCATGFCTTRFLSTVMVTGRKGARLEDAWADGPQAYLGMTVPRFPNLFMLYGPNTNQGSILFMLECQTAYVARHLRRMRDEGLVTVEVRPEAFDRYNERLQADLGRIGVWQIDCNHYYRAPSGRIVTQYPYDMSDYRARTTTPDDDAYAVQVGLPFGVR